MMQTIPGSGKSCSSAVSFNVSPIRAFTVRFSPEANANVIETLEYYIIVIEYVLSFSIAFHMIVR